VNESPPIGSDRPARGTRRRTRAVQITDRDRELLAFAAEHRFVLSAHAQALLGVSASVAQARLRALKSVGVLSGERDFYRQPTYHQVTSKGLAAIGSDLSRPRFDLSAYWHDVGVAWLWLAARAGTFGSLRDVVSERRMRSSDSSPDPPAQPFGVRLGGFGAGGRQRLHYPDLLLRTAEGHTVAIELELSGKKRTRLEGILGGYGLDRAIDAVVYFVNDAALARVVKTSAERLGLSSVIHVQRFEWDLSLRPLARSAGARRIHTAEPSAERGQ
jgi:hypothetical protein